MNAILITGNENKSGIQKLKRLVRTVLGINVWETEMCLVSPDEFTTEDKVLDVVKSFNRACGDKKLPSILLVDVKIQKKFSRELKDDYGAFEICVAPDDCVYRENNYDAVLYSNSPNFSAEVCRVIKVLTN